LEQTSGHTKKRRFLPGHILEMSKRASTIVVEEGFEAHSTLLVQDCLSSTFAALDRSKFFAKAHARTQ
jgi:hypothetical protein